MANIVGKRYVCRVCGSEFIVTKGGSGTLMCHGQPMDIKEAATTKAQPDPGRGTSD